MRKYGFFLMSMIASASLANAGTIDLMNKNVPDKYFEHNHDRMVLITTYVGDLGHNMEIGYLPEPGQTKAFSNINVPKGERFSSIALDRLNGALPIHMDDDSCANLKLNITKSSHLQITFEEIPASSHGSTKISCKVTEISK